MQTDPVALIASRSQDSSLGGAPNPRSMALSGLRSDGQHQFIQQAFRDAGGVASGDQIAYLLRDQLDQPISTVARWIVGRHVVSYEWRCQPMLPLFQFDLPRVAVRAPVAAVIRELRDAYTDCRLAMWFVEPNLWLDGARPVQLIEASPHAVLDAARADRLVASH
jgi:hypothetical protein